MKDAGDKLQKCKGKALLAMELSVASAHVWKRAGPNELQNVET